MGIHTGRPTIGEEGYVGLDAHRGARICAAGHGGQVLVSRTVDSFDQAWRAGQLMLREAAVAMAGQIAAIARGTGSPIAGRPS